MGSHTRQGTVSSRRRVITVVQVLLAVVALACVAWLAAKLVGYYQGQQFYKGIQAAYAQENEIDFDALCADYPEAVAWIRVDDLETIDYPVMRADDNDYYLHNDSAGNPSADGSIFLDYRNNADFSDDLHTIIYGHNMRDGSMFGTLISYQEEEFFKQGSGMFTIYTPKGSYRYQIFAVNVVDPTDDVFMVGFKDPTIFDSFVSELKNSSMYDTGVQANGDDQIVTLSTCSSADRLVVSAKRVGD